MRLVVSVIVSMVAALTLGCDERIGEYVAASSISDKGFASSASMPFTDGQQVRIWGFVDYRNLYGHADAREVLGDLWSGDGPAPDYWRFNLKARADDAAGHSFAVRVPNDGKRDNILQVFVANARLKKPTRVFLKGRLFTFDAPTNLDVKTGLFLDLESSADILFSNP